MDSMLIHNIGTLITGDIKAPLLKEDSVYIADQEWLWTRT